MKHVLVIYSFNPLTPRSNLLFSLLSTIQFLQCYNSENLVSDQLIIPRLIFFFILITSLVDIVLILLGEILPWSLVEVKGLTPRSNKLLILLQSNTNRSQKKKQLLIVNQILPFATTRNVEKTVWRI